MTYAKRQLEQELAEVASGRRDSVNAGTQSQVSWDEDSERSRRQAHELELQRVATQQLEASRESERRADRAAALAYEVSRESLEVSHEALRLQHESDTQARQHQVEMAKAAQAQLNFSREAHAASMEAAEDRHDSAQRDQRVQSSPTYSAVLTLVDLHKRERQIQEEKDVEKLLAPVVSAFDALEIAVRAVDGEIANDAAAAKKADAEASARRESKITAARVEVGGLNAKTDAIRLQLKKYRISLNPVSWGGYCAQQRQELRAAASDLKDQLSIKEREIEHLSHHQPHSTTNETVHTRAERVVALIKQSAIEGLVERVDSKIESWLSREPRSAEIQTLLGGWGNDEFEIDYDLCVTLDHVRTKSGGSVSYPGLGKIPFGAELQAAIEKLDSLRKSTPGFAVDGAPPKGIPELTVLRTAADCGYFPGGPEEKLIPLGRLNGDPQLIRAASVVLLNQDAKISTLQRHLRVGYSKASSLMQSLEQAGIVSSMNGAGQRSVLIKESIRSH